MAGAGNAMGSAVTNVGSAWVQRPQAQVQAQEAQRRVMPQAQPQPQPMAQSGNVYQQSAQALGQAQQTAGRLANFQMTPMQAAQLGPVERMKAVGQVADINAPNQIAVDQLRTMDIGQYMNPYTQQVIETGQQDIERQRQLASNQLGAQAQAARAFGGSRQAVQEGVLAGEAARQAAQLSAQQRQAGFQQAIQSGQFDIGQTQAARTLASQQAMQASTLNQQAAEMAAAREQAARAGNMQAANQFAMQQAQLEQQARQANFGGQFQAAGIQSGAASQLGNLSNLGFGFGQQITAQQAQQGAQQQMLQQALIDAAKGQYAGFTGAPQQSLGLPIQALTGMPSMGQTTTQQPGLFNYLALAASMAGASDRRLKTNVEKIGEKNGVNYYKWDWTEEGERIKGETQPAVGVMADELKETHPHLVFRASDGYLRVNYHGLHAELFGA